MSKYQPLTERLTAHPTEEWRASFAEIEEVLGFPLPKAARAGNAWWLAQAAKPHARAWYGPGWSIGEVDPAGGRVVFRRVVSEPALQGAPAPVISRAPRWGVTAAIAGGAVLVGAIGALALRGRVRKPPQPEA